jgi:hypothetical protein
LCIANQKKGVGEMKFACAFMFYVVLAFAGWAAPEVYYVGATSYSTNAATTTFEVYFSEDVTGVTASNFTVIASGGVSGASVQSVTGSGAEWTVLVNTGTGDGAIDLDLDQNLSSIINGASEPLTQSHASDDGVYIDKTAPYPTSIGLTSDYWNPADQPFVEFVIRFPGELVTGFSASNFQLVTTGGISGVSIIQIRIAEELVVVRVDTGTGDGTIKLNLNQNLSTIADEAGNPLAGPYTNGQVVTIVKSAPVVNSITPIDASPTSAATVRFDVQFNKRLVDLSASNFSIDSSGLSGSSIASVTEVGIQTWRVTVNTGTGNGTLSIDLNNNLSTVVDFLAQPLSGAFTSGGTYTVNR